MISNPAPAVRGMLWMAATGLIFVVMNAIMKWLSQELDPWLVGFLRYLIGAAVMLGPALRLGVRTLWPKAPGLQLVRGLFHATGARWAAVLVGFAGVLLVVEPWERGGVAGISTGMLLMLASAPVFAGSFLTAKALTRHDRSDVVVLWQHLWVSVLLVGFALAYWAQPTPAQWALLVLCGFLGAGGHYCMTRAFRAADISAVQPVKFLELVWAALLGVLVFGTVPAGATVIGGVVILVSTLLLAGHESRMVAPVKESGPEAK